MGFHRASIAVVVSFVGGLGGGAGCVMGDDITGGEPTDEADVARLCEPRPRVPGGMSAVGLGAEFRPIKDGQVVILELGYQRLWKLELTARVTGMDVGDGERGGDIYVRAFRGDKLISLDVGCRVRDFAVAASADVPPEATVMQLASPYNVTIDPAFLRDLDGAEIRLQVEVHDRLGRQAIDERLVVARFPG